MAYLYSDSPIGSADPDFQTRVRFDKEITPHNSGIAIGRHVLAFPQGSIGVISLPRLGRVISIWKDFLFYSVSKLIYKIKTFQVLVVANDSGKYKIMYRPDFIMSNSKEGFSLFGHLGVQLESNSHT